MTTSDVDEAIVIVEYNADWPSLFRSEQDRVKKALDGVATTIEHFGSTAVPGMAGKPIVDLLVGVRDLCAASERVPALEALGYENFGEIFVPGRIYLRRRAHTSYNIAMTVEGGKFWSTQMIVRDFLRAHPAEAAAYSESKRVTYAGGSRLFSTYSQAKGPFLAGLIERADQWHTLRGH